MIELPYPHKALWPNGRPHWAAKHRETKKHRGWAKTATLADRTRPEKPARLVATFYPKPKGPLPDRDGCSASLKAYQDGIADAYGIDDSTFAEPRIQFGERCANGKVVIHIDEVETFQAFGDVAARVVAKAAEDMA